MSTDSQKKANQANAKKSTGPKSKKGKAASAKNAQTHGLTLPPDRADVENWYRIILADLSAVFDPFHSSFRQRAALSLAEAEASLARVSREEQKQLSAMAKTDLNSGQRSLSEIASASIDDPDFLAILIQNTEDKVEQAGPNILLQEIDRLPAIQRKRLRMLTRYRKEAESRRRRALRFWIEISGAEMSETKPI